MKLFIAVILVISFPNMLNTVTCKVKQMVYILIFEIIIINRMCKLTLGGRLHCCCCCCCCCDLTPPRPALPLARDPFRLLFTMVETLVYCPPFWLWTGLLSRCVTTHYIHSCIDICSVTVTLVTRQRNKG